MTANKQQLEHENFLAVSFADARLKITRVLPYRSTASAKYEVQLVSGAWPCHDDLITLCDGDMPPTKNHFGGAVQNLSDNLKRVTVYTD